MGFKFDPEHADRLTADERQQRETPAAWFPHLGLQPGLRIIEIGIGPGFYIPYIWRHIMPGGVLVGTDIRREMLQRARERTPELPGVALVETEEVRLPFRSESFDGAFLVHLLHELDHPQGSLREVHRILRPHGILWVWDWDPRGLGEFGPSLDKRISAAQARAWLKQAGFRVTTLPSYVAEHYFYRAEKLAPWQVFDDHPDRYDAWFNREPGRTLYHQELAALYQVWTPVAGPVTLEIGAGSGRFASPLGIRLGLDPALGILKIAHNRGIQVIQARAEELPLAPRTVDQILLVVTLCFVDDRQQMMKEIRRVLRPDGVLVIGWIPADSPWGKAYRSKARAGHLFYRTARFITVEEVLALLEQNGFHVEHAVSTLLTPPGKQPPDPEIRPGIMPHAGFVALRGRLMNHGSHT